MATAPDLNSSDGMTPWTGGACPVIPGTEVETLARDGFRCRKVIDGNEPDVEWQHLPDCHPEWDIIAYRIVEGA